MPSTDSRRSTPLMRVTSTFTSYRADTHSLDGVHIYLALCRFHFAKQVVLLEVDIVPELGPTARVCCYVSLVDNSCPRGRVVYSTALYLPSRRPRVFRIGGGLSHVIGPGRAYTVCFGGISTEDARCRVGRQVFVFRPHGDNSGRLGRGDMMETFGTSLGGFPTLRRKRPFDLLSHPRCRPPEAPSCFTPIA